MPDPKDGAHSKIDEPSYHEALDRTHTINIMIDNLLSEHPAIKAHPDLRALLTELEDCGGNLYQAIGKYWAESNR